MASHEPVQLSQSHQIKVVGTFGAAIWRAVRLTLAWTVERSRASWPIKRRFGVAFVRQAGSLTHEEIRATTPPTGQQIREYCKDHKLPLESVDVDLPNSATPSATLHFINCRPEHDAPILFYVHGGGYVNPILKDGHIPYAIHIALTAKWLQGHVVLLEYTLAPQLKYPGQLEQANGALNLLLSHRKPEQIMIAGDSAGGNIVMALLAHIKQKHQQIPETSMAPSSKLGAMLLMSPWVSLETSAPSFKENITTDYLTFEGMGDFQEMWNPDNTHVWAQPLLGGADFWKSPDLPVKKTLITAGKWEVLRDQVVAMAQAMDAVPAGQDAEARVQLALSEQEVHVQCVFDEALGLHDSDMAKSIDDWLLSLWPLVIPTNLP